MPQMFPKALSHISAGSHDAADAAGRAAPRRRAANPGARRRPAPTARGERRARHAGGHRDST